MVTHDQGVCLGAEADAGLLTLCSALHHGSLFLLCLVFLAGFAVGLEIMGRWARCIYSSRGDGYASACISILTALGTSCSTGVRGRRRRRAVRLTHMDGTEGKGSQVSSRGVGSPHGDHVGNIWILESARRCGESTFSETCPARLRESLSCAYSTQRSFPGISSMSGPAFHPLGNRISNVLLGNSVYRVANLGYIASDSGWRTPIASL